MSDSEEQPASAVDVVTCAVATDLPEATAIVSYLEGHGIEAVVADGTTAGLVWTWQQAMGGVRIQVPADQLEDAKRLLEVRAEDAGTSDGGPGQDTADADAEPSQADSAAHRAMVASIAAWLLVPLLHPYTLARSLRALAMSGITPAGRRHARRGIAVSLVGMIVGGGFLILVLRHWPY